jgi:hypothetical protein
MQCCVGWTELQGEPDVLMREMMILTMVQSVCASVVLAIDILYRPNSPEAPLHRACLNEALKRIEIFSDVSVSLDRVQPRVVLTSTRCRRSVDAGASSFDSSSPRTQDSDDLLDRSRRGQGRYNLFTTSLASNLRQSVDDRLDRATTSSTKPFAARLPSLLRSPTPRRRPTLAAPSHPRRTTPPAASPLLLPCTRRGSPNRRRRRCTSPAASPLPSLTLDSPHRTT